MPKKNGTWVVLIGLAIAVIASLISLKVYKPPLDLSPATTSSK